jgi:hypothetical protein
LIKNVNEIKNLNKKKCEGHIYFGYYLDLVNRANWGLSTPVVRYVDAGAIEIMFKFQLLLKSFSELVPSLLYC